MREAKSERFSRKSGPVKTRAQVDREKREDGMVWVGVGFWVLVGVCLLIWRDDALLGLTAFVLAHLVAIRSEIRKTARPRPETVEMRSVEDARREERRERARRRSVALEAMAVAGRIGDAELYRKAAEEFDGIGSEVSTEQFIGEALDSLDR
jgi:hypothetical protein